LINNFILKCCFLTVYGVLNEVRDFRRQIRGYNGYKSGKHFSSFGYDLKKDIGILFFMIGVAQFINAENFNPGVVIDLGCRI